MRGKPRKLEKCYNPPGKSPDDLWYSGRVPSRPKSWRRYAFARRNNSAAPAAPCPLLDGLLHAVPGLVAGL